LPLETAKDKYVTSKLSARTHEGESR
jgi:hypothetical protein